MLLSWLVNTNKNFLFSIESNLYNLDQFKTILKDHFYRDLENHIVYNTASYSFTQNIKPSDWVTIKYFQHPVLKK